MKKIVLLVSSVCLLLMACDDGKIYPKEAEDVTGKKITLTTRFKGIEAWPEAYYLVLAGFADESRVPVISKIIPTPSSENEEISVTLNGIKEDVEVISVSVVTKGRGLIHHFYRMELNEDSEEEFTLPVSEINLASYDRIQSQVFNLYCASCHGAGNHAAAGLYLTTGKSYSALVNKPATTLEEGKMLVEPENINNSFLHEILISDVINYNHTDVLPESELITLIDTWIKQGAQTE